MVKKLSVLITFALLGAVSLIMASDHDRSLVVTSSNSSDNQLLVFDTSGALIQSVPTFGQGGANGNAGGIATKDEAVAVVNFGSQNVSIFSRGDAGFEFSQLVPVASPPVSVAFAKDHLYVLGTTTIESNRIEGAAVEAAVDGIVVLLQADGSAAQVGVVGDELVVTEKSGTIDVAAEGDLLALVESDGGGVSHLTQFRIDEDGNLTRIVSTLIASAANGIAIITER